MNSTQHSHRPTGMKQSNKPFKSRFASKGSAKEKSKGKVNRTTVSKKHKVSSKSDRRNAARLQQQAKRQEIQLLQRCIGGLHGAPKLVAVISLCPDIDTKEVLKTILDGSGVNYTEDGNKPYGPTTITLDRWKQKLTFYAAPNQKLYDILEAAKVADFIVFCLSPVVEVDEFGDLIIQCILAQGLPSVVSIVAGLNELPQKRHAPILKSLSSYASQFFGDDKLVFSTDSESDIANLVRHISQRIPKSITWRDNHSYMLVDEYEAIPEEDNNEFVTLKVAGYGRGRPWSENRLVHISEVGDFQLKFIELPTSHHIVFQSNTMMTDSSEESNGQNLIKYPNPEEQDTLEAENIPDPLANDQTWPTEEELAEAEEIQKNHLRETALGKRRKVRVPKGTSSYQAAWIVESDDEIDSEEDDEEGDDDEMDDGMRKDGEENDSDREDIELEEYEEVELDERHSEEDVDEEEAAETLIEYQKQRAQLSRDDLMFPDEVDTPIDTPARVRFAKYRGLKSFRTSSWDPMENLPLEYARIFDFEDFQRTRKRVLSSDDGVPPFSKLSLNIKHVSKETVDLIRSFPFFTLFGLFEYEQKTSVLHYVATRVSQYEEPVQSKDEMTLLSGFRKLVARPIYSQHTKENKHKFERFFHPNTTAVATIYGPIQFPPSPILMFKENGPGQVPTLVATGSLMEVRPQRIIAKRIILTGDIFKVHKRVVTVRHMFFNPEDVDWFKTVQLRTKSGRVGHIKESLGTHGYMKCIFDGQVKSDDVVCMHLYKRVYPPWKARIYNRHTASKVDDSMVE